MIKWAPYVFVRLTLCLITGILLAIHSNIDIQAYYLLQCGFISLLGFYGVLYIYVSVFRKETRLACILGLTALLTVTLFGFLLTHHRTETHKTDHIIHQDSSFTHYSGTLIAQVQEREKTYKAEIAVDQMYASGKWQKASGTVLVFLEKKNQIPAYGSQLLLKGLPQQVAAPLNPEEFNYRDHLRHRQIYHQHVVKSANYVVYGSTIPNPVLAWAIQLRQYADGFLKKSISTQNEYAIASGLILGIRDGLDNQIKQAYASAGAMHVLAVSGAHVAIVFAFLSLLFTKIKNLKYGNWIFALIVLGVLWLYAFVTGLSASVLRAVVMLTFVVIAQASRRQTNIYNTLAVSAFALLCYNPFMIMDVGFQLSYVAVLGIIYLYPKLYHLVDFRSWLLNKAWAFTCVSIAAMLATVPMSLFYFHQFPSYFLLSNLPVMVLSSIILYIGLTTLLFSWVPYLSFVLAYLLEKAVWLLNFSVFFTESLPGALIKGISISLIETVLLYALIVSLLLFSYHKRLFFWHTVFCIVCVLVSMQVAEIFQQQRQKQLAIYAVNNTATLSIINGRNHLFLASPALLKDNSSVNFHLINHWWSQGISESILLPFNQNNISNIAFQQKTGYAVMVWQGKTFVFLQQPLLQQTDALKLLHADYLVIQNNSVRKLAALQVHFNKVVIDSSNKKYLAKQLKQEAKTLTILCHSVYEDGAFILRE